MKQIADPSFQSLCKSDTCADVVRMSVTLDDGGFISDIGTEVYGCGYSIAGSSLFNETAKGVNINSVENIWKKKLSSVIDDVPESNKTCVNLPYKAFKLIYDKYSSNGKE
jgi:NifU-like protein involved in Fe-S cluster formation